jgi:hypothetical protein
MIVNKKENIKKLKQKQQQEKQEFLDKLKSKIENNNKIVNYNRLNKPFVLKNSYNSIIPLHLYTCWHTKELPPLMKANYDFLVESNPRITFHLYDDVDCIAHHSFAWRQELSWIHAFADLQSYK